MNHFVFATGVFVDGVSVIDEAVEKYAHVSEDEALFMKNFMSIPFSPAFIRGIHAIPCPYHNYYFHTDEMLAEELKEFEEGNVRGEVVSRLEDELFEIYRDENLDIKPKQLEQRGGARYSDAACNLIESIHTNRGDIQYVDVRNDGCIEGLPSTSAVEVACRITADGPKPLTTGELKPPHRRLRADDEGLRAHGGRGGDYWRPRPCRRGARDEPAVPLRQARQHRGG